MATAVAVGVTGAMFTAGVSADGLDAVETINGGGVVLNGSLTRDVTFPSEVTKQVGGGTWTYGVNKFNVFSKYSNSSKKHKSSCKGTSSNPQTSGWVNSGVLASSVDSRSTVGSNYAWYDYE